MLLFCKLALHSFLILNNLYLVHVVKTMMNHTCPNMIISVGYITNQYSCCCFVSQNIKVAVKRIRSWRTGKLSPKDTWMFWISCYVTFPHQQDNSVWDADKADNSSPLIPDLQIESSEFTTLVVCVCVVISIKHRNSNSDSGSLKWAFYRHSALRQQGFMLMILTYFWSCFFLLLAPQSTPLGPGTGLEAEPGEDTLSYCALQRSLQGAAWIYFSTVWFTDSFCWTSSLVPVCCRVLSYSEILIIWCTYARHWAAVSLCRIWPWLSGYSASKASAFLHVSVYACLSLWKRL